MEKLVTHFKSNIHHYKTPEYNESEVRPEFIDKFFICLGWDGCLVASSCLMHWKHTDLYKFLSFSTRIS